MAAGKADREAFTWSRVFTGRGLVLVGAKKLPQDRGGDLVLLAHLLLRRLTGRLWVGNRQPPWTVADLPFLTFHRLTLLLMFYFDHSLCNLSVLLL